MCRLLIPMPPGVGLGSPGASHQRRVGALTMMRLGQESRQALITPYPAKGASSVLDMSKNIDVYVCKPESGITKSLAAVFLQFEVMDPGTLEGSGKSHALGMTTTDAMWLLKHLQYMQKRFDLPLPDGPIADMTPPT